MGKCGKQGRFRKLKGEETESNKSVWVCVELIANSREVKEASEWLNRTSREMEKGVRMANKGRFSNREGKVEKRISNEKKDWKKHRCLCVSMV